MGKRDISDREEEQKTNSNIFSEENIEKIRHINDLLKKEEQLALAYAQRLHASIKESRGKKELWDYNFHTCLQVFTAKVSMQQMLDTDEDNHIYEEDISLFNEMMLKADNSFYTGNWNEYQQTNHPLANIPFCYSMHCIAFHSDLTWQDILDIAYIWIELKVDYLFRALCVDSYFEEDEIKTDS